MATAAVVLTLSSCSATAQGTPFTHDDAAQGALTGRHAGLRAAPTPPTPYPSIGAPEPERWPEVSVTINSLSRSSSGLVTLVWTLKNSGSKNFYPNEYFTSTYKYASNPAAKITLTDESAKLRYNPLKMTPSLMCTCTKLVGTVDAPTDDFPANLYDTYKLPNSVQKVTIEIPGFSPLKNVPIK